VPHKGLIAVARGEKEADLLLVNARVVNVFNGEIEQGNVAVYNGLIAGVGDYDRAKEVIDLDGAYIAPAFIDGHIHLESTMLDIGQYAKVAVARGTLTVVTDLHELSNVVGIQAIDYVLEKAARLPLDVFVMAPSCVPATHLETSGASITAKDIKELLKKKNVIGLGEIMNFPGVLMGDVSVLDKLKEAEGKPRDGHAPGLTGKDLSAYIGAGIGSDHESVNYAEGAEKLSKGMYLMIREGSVEKNLETLLPLVTDKTYKRCFFVIDDRSCADLMRYGDMDDVVRRAISLGLEPARAIQLATINCAEYFKLEGVGAIGAGYRANMIVFKDIKDIKVEKSFYNGQLVAQNGCTLVKEAGQSSVDIVSTVNIKNIGLQELEMKGDNENYPVIGIVSGQIITDKLEEKIKIDKAGNVKTDTDADILKLVVVERHHGTGNIGRALVKGFGLQRGALASTIAHDSHNIIAVGVADKDILVAIKELERIGGGLCVVVDGEVKGNLPLPIGGLMSDKPLEQVVESLGKLERLVKDMGTELDAPFAALSFLALPVIPELKLTDKGLVDVAAFKIINN